METTVRDFLEKETSFLWVFKRRTTKAGGTISIPGFEGAPDFLSKLRHTVIAKHPGWTLGGYTVVER